MDWDDPLKNKSVCLPVVSPRVHRVGYRKRESYSPEPGTAREKPFAATETPLVKYNTILLLHLC